MTRVYVPTTMAGLADLRASGAVPAGLEGYAATPAVRVDLSGCMDEELEFAVSSAAADASEHMLTDAGATTGRRVVLVLELGDSDVVTLDDAAGLVRVAPPVPLRQVDAILADPGSVWLASSDVALAWFAVQELADLLA